MTRYIALFLLFIPLATLAQTEPSQDFNSRYYRFKNTVRIDSGIIAPREDTTNIRPSLLSPGYIRWRPQDQRLYIRDSVKFRSFAFSDEIPSVTGFVTLATNQDDITGGKTFKGYLDKDRANGTLNNIIGFSTNSVAEWNVGNGTGVNDFSLANATTGRRPWTADAVSDYVTFATSIVLPNTTSATTGVIYKGGTSDWFAHNYKAATAEGYNTFFGRHAGNFTMAPVTIPSEASFNSAFGDSALRSVTTGWSNAFFAYHSGVNITSGKYNSGFGVHALDKTTTADRNTAVGHYAGYENTTGAENTYVGASAGRGPVTTSFNSAFGVESQYTATGGFNSSFGHNSLNKATSSFNQMFGKNSGQSITSGQENNGFGFAALGSLTTGSSNTGFGQNAGFTNTTGSRNVYLGYGAGYYETGSDKFFVDNRNRANEADGRVKALIYGVFDAATINQRLTINAAAKINGAIIKNIRTVTGNTTLDASDYTINVNNSGNITLSLPAAASLPGVVYVIKKISNNAFTVAVDPNGSENIEGSSTSYSMGTYLQSITIQSDGTAWWIY